MARIIKPGKVVKCEVIFECESCGCVFAELLENCEIRDGDRISFERNFIKHTIGNGSVVSICPDCHNVCYIEIPEEGLKLHCIEEPSKE